MRIIQLKSMIAITLLAVSTAFAVEPVGNIVSLNGKATATEQNGAIRNLELKAPVYLNDKIKTEVGSSLQMMFLDESVLSQGEKSEMTIDEYVYNPGKKDDNACTLNLGKGLFRAVTARITALNPERFKVKTRLATIGIRGCEIGFVITERGVNVFALTLPDGKSIVITLAAGVDASAFTSGGTMTRDNIIQILKSGVMVQIENDGRTKEQLITPQKAIDLLEEITIPFSDSPDLNNYTDSRIQQNQQGMLGDDEKTAEEELRQRLTPPPGTPEETPVETPPPAPAPEPVLTFVQQNTGPGWKWGVWQYPDLTPARVQYFAQSPNQDLTGADVLSLIATVASGSGYYNMLPGSGDASAVVKNGSNRYLLTGTCNVGFDISLGVTTWSAESIFNATPGPLSDLKGNSLSFRIDGNVDGSGNLIGSFSSYSMTVDGVNHGPGTVQSSTINANLIGTTGPVSVGGLIGHFNVTHTTGQTVQGGFVGTPPY